MGNSQTGSKVRSNTFYLVRRELRKRVLTILALVSLTIVTTGVGLVQPLVFKTLIDDAIPTQNRDLVIWLLAAMVMVPTLGVGLSIAQDYLKASIGELVSQSLRLELFDHLVRARITDLEKFTSAELVFRLTRSCGRIGDVYIKEQVLPMISHSILLSGTLAIMLFLNWHLSLIAMLAFPLSYILTKRLEYYSKSLLREFTNTLEAGQNYAQEVMMGLRTVRAFNGQERERGRWFDWLRRHKRIRVRVDLFHNLVRTLLPESVNNLALGVVFGYGAFEVIQGRTSIGSLVAFLAYIPRAYSILRSILGMRTNTQEAQINAEKIDELFALPQEASTKNELQASSDLGAKVEFQKVFFQYGRGDFGVKNLSFCIEPGEFLGIVGLSGGGKSTVIDLLMGFHLPQAGKIMVDGVDIQQMSLESLREQIGFIPQDIFLWNDTISANIAYPKDKLDPQQVEKYARAAQIHDFVESLAKGYDTIVGERGHTLSGGERQRLAFARAIAREPRILLFDEATAGLDALTELKIRDVIAGLRKGRTTIAVAHRLVTIIHADKILVIDKGQGVEFGSPRDLLTRRGVFFDLYQAQLLESPVDISPTLNEV